VHAARKSIDEAIDFAALKLEGSLRTLALTTGNGRNIPKK